jgi:hypothetical protein
MKINCTVIRNLNKLKKTFDKEAFINNQILQYSIGEINRSIFI